MSAREFHIGDVLTITTSRLVSPRHMDGIYDLLNWMTGDNLFTHQLPRAAQECGPHLLLQHPDLQHLDIPEEFGGPDEVWQWLADQVEMYGETRLVEPLPTNDHTRIDPLAELRMLRPDIPILAVEVDRP